MTQLPLFDQGDFELTTPSKIDLPDTVSVDAFEASILYSAIGDSLGWPTEFGRYPSTVQAQNGRRYLTDMVQWSKLVGGRFWGYIDEIEAGDYSDDTQLSLCVARCIDAYGRFQPEQFAYLELPLWLHYERGGGRSIKTAARSMIAGKKEWYLNFYSHKSKIERESVDYRNAGANGAAMRVLPIALANVGRQDEVIRSSFLNAIVTHGHPRAILGTLIYASTITFLMRERQPERIFAFAKHIAEDSTRHLRGLSELDRWLHEWDRKPLEGQNFQSIFASSRAEALRYIAEIERVNETTPEQVYRRLGATSTELKGSGLSTVLVAIYLFSKYFERQTEGILTAVNMLGSDTDTIANMLGGLNGAFFGTSAIPQEWLRKIQDATYLREMANFLFEIASGAAHTELSDTIYRDDALLRIKAWEIGLHELFWDALTSGDRLVHPSLGPGTVLDKTEKPIAREGHVAKLIKINFDCGQSCKFHSRVATDGTVSESLAKELNKVN